MCKKTNSKVRCSRQCQFVDQSNGKIKIHLNGRTGYRSDLGVDLYFKSALEADFARVMRYSGIAFNYEQKTFLTGRGAYTPDFYLPEYNVYIELKGVEGSESGYARMMTKNLASHSLLEEQGVRILTITQREFITVLRAVRLWNIIPNLEQRNYKKTAHLVTKHEDQATPTSLSFTTYPID